MGLLLVILLIVLLVGGIPTAPWGSWHSMGWGPSSLGVILLVVLLVLLLTGRI